MLGEEHPAPKLVTAIVARAPVSTTDKIDVRIPSIGPQLWRGLPWTTRGTLLPTLGARCLVAFDDDGVSWVVCWDW